MKLVDLIPKYQPVSVKKHPYTFTVFTPVYNRADTLHRVFESLNKQTFRDFELLLINDGSKDNSHEVVLELMKTANFHVNYINNPTNKHKMACYSQAIHLAEGQFILPFDSDDACEAEALKTLFDAYTSIPDEKKPFISGVTCLCKDQNGVLVGEKFPENTYYSNTFKRNIEAPRSSEKWGFTKTDILRGIQINEAIYSRGYIPEGVLWELISKEGFETKYTNDVLRIYYLDTENRISIQNHEKDAFGMAIYSLSILNWFYKKHLFKHPKVFVKRLYTLLRASQYLEFRFKDYFSAIESKLLKLLFALGWPFKNLFR